jgi:hypothetical protein
MSIGFVAVTACTPTFDWREVRPANGGVVALFPCKPVSDRRQENFGRNRVELTLHACKAGGATFALIHTDIGDPELVAPALTALRLSLTSHLHGTVEGRSARHVPGMTPGAQATGVIVRGQAPDGSPASAQALFFAKDARVYQATVLAPHVDAETAEFFFASLRLP